MRAQKDELAGSKGRANLLEVVFPRGVVV
jgi:hypothetical protein